MKKIKDKEKRVRGFSSGFAAKCSRWGKLEKNKGQGEASARIFIRFCREVLAVGKIMVSNKASVKGRFLAALIALLLLCTSGVVSILCFSLASAEESRASENSIFRVEKGASVIGFGELPSYFEGSEYRGTKNGAMVQFTKSNVNLTYASVIDLDALGSREFIELQMTPKNRMQKEANSVYIQLTDIYDENNFITVRLQSADVHTYSQYTYVAAGADGLYLPQGHLMNSEVYNEFGSASASTFYGRRDGFNPCSIKLYYDDDEKSIYVDPSEWGTKYRVIDFTDPLLGGKFESFNGLSSKKVRLSIYVDGIIGTDMNIMVQSVAGKTVQNLMNEPAGEIQFAVNNGGAAQFTDAVAGGIYPIAEAVSYNNKQIFSSPIAKVYYGDHRISIPVRDGFFETAQTGNYTIEYETRYNSLIVKSKPIVVTASAGYETPIQITSEPEFVGTAVVGEKVLLADAVAEGGIGNLTVNKRVLFGKNEVTVVKDGDLDLFVPEKAGVYTVEYTVSDERGGKSEKYTDTIDVMYAQVPSFLEARVPQTLVKGLPFRFPTVETYCFGEDGALGVKTRILIENVDYSNQDFMPVSDFTVKYEISLIDDPSKTVTKDYLVQVVDAAQKTGMYIKDSSLYFRTENADSSSRKTGTRFTAAHAGKSSASFIKQVLSDEFSIEVMPDGVNALTITLYDASDASKQMTITFEKIDSSKGYSRVLLNGKYIGQVSGNYGSASVSLTYDANTISFSDANGNVVMKPDRWADGTEFKGFSDYIYFELGTDGAQGAWYELRSISGQTFAANGADGNVRLATPVIVYSYSLAGVVRKTLNETFTVPGAKSFDVFGAITEFTLTITSPSGKILYSDSPKTEAFDITLTEKGSYTIVFVAENNFGRNTPDRFIVSAYDVTPPVITVNGEYSASANVGDSVTIIGAAAKDNSEKDIPVYIYITEPDGYSCRLQEGKSYQFTQSGKYVIKYYACDEEMNYSLKEYTVFCR